jgi:formylglycine-generating enzyme required for sulfatase activity
MEPEMVTIPTGKFQMGCVSGKGCNKDELPVRTVTFTKPFAIGKYEVTFAEYDRFAEATGRQTPGDSGWGRGKRSVIHVSWQDARAYAFWLSEQSGKRYRLPTEAEWEYATRGGTTTPFSTGECINTDQAKLRRQLPLAGLPENRRLPGKDRGSRLTAGQPLGPA